MGSQELPFELTQRGITPTLGIAVWYQYHHPAIHCYDMANSKCCGV